MSGIAWLQQRGEACQRQSSFLNRLAGVKIDLFLFMLLHRSDIFGRFTAILMYTRWVTA